MISIHAPFLLRAPVLRRIKASQCPVARKAPFRGLLRPTSGLLALALWALAAPLSAEAPAAHPAPRPAPGPALVAPLLNGQPFDLAAQHGQVVVVHLWASWCPPCRAEMPLLDRFARSHGEVMVLGLSFDKKRDEGAVRQVMAGLSFPTALAARATRNGFGTPDELPQTLVIDARGQIVARIAGGRPALSEAALQAAVNAATRRP